MALIPIAAGTTDLGTPTAGGTPSLNGGSQTITTNLDWSGVNQAAGFEVPLSFNGQVGASTGPFIGSTSGTLWYNAGGGDFYWDSNSLDSDVSPLLIQPVGSNGHMHLDGTSGTISRADCGGGKLTVAVGVIITNVFVFGNGQVRLYDSGAVTDPTLIKNRGGVVWLDRGCGIFEHYSGTSYLQSINTNAITTLTVEGSGCWLSNIGGSTITTANLFGGIPNISKLERTLTITDTNINMALPGAAEFLDNNLIILTNPATKYFGR